MCCLLQLSFDRPAPTTDGHLGNEQMPKQGLPEKWMRSLYGSITGHATPTHPQMGSIGIALPDKSNMYAPSWCTQYQLCGPTERGKPCTRCMPPQLWIVVDGSAAGGDLTCSNGYCIQDAYVASMCRWLLIMSGPRSTWQQREYAFMVYSGWQRVLRPSYLVKHMSS